MEVRRKHDSERVFDADPVLPERRVTPPRRPRRTASRRGRDATPSRRAAPPVTPAAAAAPLRGDRDAASDPHARDADLVARSLAGDGEAWAELLTRHQPLIHSIARRHRLSPEAAEDLVQTTCVIMLERLELLRDHRSLSAWIATTATRACWRAGRARGEAELPDLAGGGPDPETAFRDAALRQAIADALETIGEPCRTLLRDLFADDASYDDLAVRLGLAVGSIGVYRRRCLTRLRHALASQGWTFPERERAR